MPPKAKAEKLETTEVENETVEEPTTDAVEEVAETEPTDFDKDVKLAFDRTEEAKTEAPQVEEPETVGQAEDNQSSGQLEVKIAVVSAPGEDPVEVDQELAEIAAAPEVLIKNDQGTVFRMGNSWTFCNTAQVKAYEVYGSAIAQQFIRVPVSELPEGLQPVAANSAEAGHVWVLVQPLG